MAEVNVGTCEGTPRLLLTRTVQDRAVFFLWHPPAEVLHGTSNSIIIRQLVCLKIRHGTPISRLMIAFPSISINIDMNTPKYST